MLQLSLHLAVRYITDCHIPAGPGDSGLRTMWVLLMQVEFLRPMTACILSERRATRPFGLCGGQPALSGKNYLIRRENGVDRHISLGGKVTLELQAGDKIRIETPGVATFPAGACCHFTECLLLNTSH